VSAASGRLCGLYLCSIGLAPQHHRDFREGTRLNRARELRVQFRNKYIAHQEHSTVPSVFLARSGSEYRVDGCCRDGLNTLQGIGSELCSNAVRVFFA
jgi:hypothetical protein